MDDLVAVDITALLLQIREGDQEALAKILPIVYAELRRTAARYMGRERRDHTLQPTAVVHEVYLRLVKGNPANWKNRAHFFALSARLIRRILVEYARGHGSAKRGGKWRQVPMEEVLVFNPAQSEDLVSLNNALDTLETLDARQSRIVDLRFFGGLSMDEIAEVLAVSVGTVKNEWAVARVWLHRELSRQKSSTAP